MDFATVESVDRTARTLVLSVRGIALPACKVGRGVRDWGDIRIGDEVRGTIREVLTVYVAPPSESSSSAWARSLTPDARVLDVDPSYRVLTVQYPNAGTEAFKVALHTPMTGVEAGDSVAIRERELVELRVWRHSDRKEGSRSGSSAGPAR